LREYTLREAIVEPSRLILYQGVLTGAFPDESLAPEMDEVIFSNCTKIIEEHDARQFGDDEIIAIMHLWRGTFRQSTWEALSTKLEPERAGGLAFVLAKKYLVDRKSAASDNERDDLLAAAQKLLTFAADNDNTPELARKQAQHELSELRSRDDP
jgi:hypothetical protein